MSTWALLVGLILLAGCVRAPEEERVPPPEEEPGEAGATRDDRPLPSVPPPAEGVLAALRAERAAERQRMVARQLEGRGIADPLVLEAMASVPRHLFVPRRVRDEAYQDSALPIAAGQTISQPYIVALMTEAVALRPGERVLEVGTGSGYQAAVLGEITQHVYTIEIVEELALQARADLDALGYQHVLSKAGDGYRGWPGHAPFDAILLTAAPDHVPPALLEQLAPGGRLCLPVGDRWGDQYLELYTKGEDGRISRRTLTGVRFVPMTGEAQGR